jgi:hypothetical protein
MLLPLPKTNQSIKGLMIVMIIGLFYSCKKIDHEPPKADENADVVYAWYKFMAKVQLPANPQPVVILNNRNFGYIGVGLYEAVRAGSKGAKSLSTKLYQMPSMPEPDNNKDYLWSESANAALASMFKQFLILSDANKASIDSMEKANYNRFRLKTSDAVLLRSQAFGRSIATTIYNWSTTDNFNLSSVGYTIPVYPGAWEPTPPAKASPVGPYLKNSRPFLAYSLTATAPPVPVPFSTDTTSSFYKAAKEIYTIGKTLTTEQKAIADWFGDIGGAGAGVPAPYHLISIITGVLQSQTLNLWQAAEMYAKTGIVLKDGGIITFRAKYQYNLIRPITYIKKHIDTAWNSYLTNPPYPEYTSGLAGFYTPLIQVLIREFGNIPVTDNAYDFRGLAPRKYHSLWHLAEEAAISRCYGGIHYRFTQNVTLQFGKELGNIIADINLLPNRYKDQ